jgi:lysophospholipase L1-like esterase
MRRLAALLVLCSLSFAPVAFAASGSKTAKATSATHKKKKAVPKRPLDLSKLPLTPIEDPAGALDPFFAALGALEHPPSDSVRIVRILHFGDSHVEADLWTGEIRRLLQARFGDGGVGYVMPGKPWRFFRHTLAKSTGTGWLPVGVGKDPGDGFVGLSAAAIAPGPKVQPAGVLAPGATYEVQVGLPSGPAPLALWVDGECAFAGPVGEGYEIPGDGLAQEVRPLPSDPCQSVVFLRGSTIVPDMPHDVSLQPLQGGDLRLLGMEFESGRSGVLYEPLGIIGAEVSNLDKWRPEVRRILLDHTAPGLIVVSYGTNEMGQNDFSEEDYLALCGRIIADLRRDAPGVPLLVTGPIDRDARRSRLKGVVKTNEPEVVDALRRAALENGAAFWDARAAMGGEGSIVAWRAAGLAQADYVHLTAPGYDKLAALLYGELMAAYGRSEAARREGTPAP